MRDLTTEIRVALGDDNILPVMFVHLDFDNNALYANTTVLNITWGGHEWLGLEGVGDIEAIKENTELKAADLSLTLSGIPQSIVQQVIDAECQGREATIYFGLLDSAHQLLSDPSIIWRGVMDTMSLALGKTATVTIKCENRFADWQRPRIQRYTDAEQQSRYPGDLGLEFIADMESLELTWGEAD